MSHEINIGVPGESNIEDQCVQALEKTLYSEGMGGFTSFFDGKAIPAGKFLLGFRTAQGASAYIFITLAETNLDNCSIRLIKEGVFEVEDYEDEPLPEIMQDCPIWLTDLGQGV